MFQPRIESIERTRVASTKEVPNNFRYHMLIVLLPGWPVRILISRKLGEALAKEGHELKDFARMQHDLSYKR